MFKALLYYRFKTILILVSAVTAITSIFLITALSAGIVTMYSDMLRTDGDIIITQKGVADTFFSDVNRSLLPQIKKIKAVKDAAAVIVGAGAIGVVPIAGIYGVSKNRFSLYSLHHGTYPQKDAEVMLGSKIDAILNHPKEIKLFNKPFHVSGVYESKIGFENGGVVISIADGEALFHKSASFLLLTLHNLEDADKTMPDITEISKDITVKSTSDFIDNYNQFKIIKISGAVIASISFFMGFLAIVSIMSIVINERRYEFGIKRALGITKLRIVMEVVLEVMALTLVAFAIAYMLSLFLLDFLQHIDKFQGYLSGDVDMTLALIVLAGSLCMSVVGALIPAFMAARIDPIVLIHQGA